jgi:Tfp pilus assembly protein PilF
VVAMRARVYCLKGDYTQALEDTNKAMELRPANSIFIDTRASVYQALGDIEKAISSWEEALKLDPDNAQIKDKLEKAKQEKESQSK